ncbi:SipW-dependent-type signal peptide-containing protein [Brevibacterium marinum]|uniref:Putative ribosomally synthesized peptide with SipW-like signal peptide n=1 Tax=Brevibacterium marinum TaxID=418643 RepID=A0A846S490_9MICO|nr:SipW-dependent-type signal peptide-containing protein [Brevibacterium marinum]NJC58565.1 putative ribosomally synthesized peptide with SipW-like signal peptide [Brevibacterium marinum]
MTQSPTRSRKFKAILAGGIVLGVGAAVTLAAWTDNEWAEGTFGAGSFNVQGSTNGTDFTDHESSDDAASLSFDLDGGDNLTPGDTVAAPFVLRLDGETSYDASVVLEDATGGGDNPAALTYGIVTVDDVASCTADATGTSIVPGGTALGSTDGAQGFELTAGADATEGAPVTLCFKVTADDTLTQDQSTNAQWQFTATSAE